MPPAALYIHIPFCKRKCAYCDFYSVAYDRSLAGAYIGVICGQIEKLERPVSTIFIGGGTPTALETADMKRLLRSASRKFAGSGREFTIEANPESLSGEKLSLFSDEGVNRLSIGVQSFSDVKLKRLGRIHNAKKAIDAVTLSKKKGFDNLNIDLIFGSPGETLDDCSAEFARAVKLPVTHISCYCLTYEKGTPLFDAKKRGKVVPADEDHSAGMYSLVMEYLPRHGFKHYEVSNFAKKGFECAHNLNYWRNDEYVGLGASAVSYIDGVRKRHVPDITEYIEKTTDGESAIISAEKLTGERKGKETAAVKIRTAEGIGFNWFKKKTGYDLLQIEADAVRRLSGAGLIRHKKARGAGSGISLTKKGFLFCDTVSSELL